MCFFVEVVFWGVIVFLVWIFLLKVSRIRGGDTELVGLIYGSELFYYECYCRLINIVFFYNVVEYMVVYI